MKRLLHNGILVLVLAVSAALGVMAVDAAAQVDRDLGGHAVVLQVESSADATATPEASGVTDLPVTGRGSALAVDGSPGVALGQALITVLVLLAAAVLSLGGIALMWRYDRR